MTKINSTFIKTMKNIKLISLVFPVLTCFMSNAQQKEVSNVKPVNEVSWITICTPSKKTLMNAPLIILDGVIVNSKQFSKVNPNDIQEMKVIRETEAIEIYGNKGINGAIIITIKENE
ncbi:TonB-dependent receptor plug domain-containing protein [Flavobacterium psychroterrae]|uniref:TonB-dependent receptor plug domain-containing protein n=1 Tax=Flavobacterium psychroterrae TaxID=2133767 RepID=A0ABS5PGB0_9FLAO|nr:TonB-dependent receptor plug domain-containing protein [Flavobacterium psychroterrae]MBS7233319.1 TonB-dependent receptor plug domain-containing protein [Flavobacterium psychroterrae]